MEGGGGKKVQVELIGGLGNQLFGYYAALWLSKVRSAQLELNVTKVATHHTAKKFDIRSLNIQGKIVEPHLSRGELGRQIARIRDKSLIGSKAFNDFYIATTGTVHDKGDGFAEMRNRLAHLPIKGDVRLKGFFAQFGFYKELVNTDSKIIELEVLNPSPEFKNLKREARMNRPIMLHVRRGDYGYGLNPVGVLSSEYYSDAIKMIEAKIDTREIWIFTNSLRESEKMFEEPKFRNLGFSYRIIDELQDHDPAESLLLQKEAGFNVIANSTFSGWAAILNRDSAGTIAPSHYYKGNTNPADYPYSDWVTCSSKWA